MKCFWSALSRVSLGLALISLLISSDSLAQWLPADEVPQDVQQTIYTEVVAQSGGFDAVLFEQKSREWYLAQTAAPQAFKGLLNSESSFGSSGRVSGTTINDILPLGENDALRNCVISSGYSASQDADDVQNLNCPWTSGNQKIQSIKQIASFANLQGLTLPGHDVCGLSFITSLSQLQTINLNDNTRIGNLFCGIGHLQQVASLRFLFLERTGLVSIPALHASANLFTVSLAGNALHSSTPNCTASASRQSVLFLNLSDNQLNDNNLTLVSRFKPMVLTLDDNSFDHFERPAACQDVFDGVSSITLNNNQSSAVIKHFADISDIQLSGLNLSGSNFTHLPEDLPTVCVDLNLSNMSSLKDWNVNILPKDKPRPYTFSLANSNNLSCEASGKFRYLLGGTILDGINTSGGVVKAKCPQLGLSYTETLPVSCDPNNADGSRVELEVGREPTSRAHVLSWEELTLESRFRDFVYKVNVSTLMNGTQTYVFEGNRAEGLIYGLPENIGHSFTVQRCLVEANGDRCSLPSLSVLSDFPITQPLGLQLVWTNPLNGVFDLHWGYPIDFFNSNPPNYFRVEFPGGQVTTISAVAHQNQWTLGSRVFSQAGNIRIQACQGSQNNPTVCSDASILSVSRPPEFQNTIPSPGVVSLSLDQNDDRLLKLQVNNNNLIGGLVDYYQITESAASGQRVREYFLDVSQSRNDAQHELDLHRITAGTYQTTVRACRRNRDGIDQCSTGSVVNPSPVVLPEPVVGFANISDSLCWNEKDGVEVDIDFDDGQVQATSTASTLSLHWAYNPGQDFEVPHYYKIHMGYTRFNLDFNHQHNPSEPETVVTTIGPIFPTSDNQNGTNHGGFEISAGASLFYLIDGFPVSYQVSACRADNSCQLVGLLTPIKDNPNTPNDDDIANECQTQSLGSGTSASMQQPTGPGDLNPGIWLSDDLPRQGFGLFWASDLRHDEVHQEYGETYDLFAYWATYQMIDARWSPVWLYAQLKESGTTDRFEGALYYPREGLNSSDAEETGTMAVEFYSGENDQGQMVRKARVVLDVNLEGGLFSDGDREYEINLISNNGIVNNLGVPNSSDFNNGVWDYISGSGSASRRDYSVLSWQHNWFEGQVVLGFDGSGLPMWANGVIDCRDMPIGTANCNVSSEDGTPKTDNATLKFHVVDQGLAPFDPQSNANDVVTSQDVGTLLRSIPDSINDLTPSGLELSGSLSISVGTGSNQRTLSVNTLPGVHTLSKKAGFHEIDFDIVNPASSNCDSSTGICTCEAVNGYCDVELTWFSDDDFTDGDTGVSVQAFIMRNGAVSPVDASSCNVSNPPQGEFTVKDYFCRIQRPGNYRFFLKSRPNTPDALDIAQSVMLVVTNPDAPTPPGDGNPALPPSPAAIGSQPESINSTKVGAIAGNFQVDQSGSASYQVPIITAPGTAGVVPQVSLEYSSQSGNGIAGVGWTLGGLSAIERCGQTYVNDGATSGVQLNNEDRLCLDGQRLLKVAGPGGYWQAGSEYRTELDNISRIRSEQSGSQLYFKVWRKDGSMSEYGNTVDSRPIANNGSNTVYSWLQNRYSDHMDNYIDYEYLHPNNNDGSGAIENYPLTIRYTGNSSEGLLPNARIEFVYTNKNAGEVGAGYLAGASLRSGKRLAGVHSVVADDQSGTDKTVRYYQLVYGGQDAYGRSTLTTLHECWLAQTPGVAVNSNQCTQPTSFNWDNNYPLTIIGDEDGDGNDDALDILAQFDDTSGQYRTLDPRFADMNGDGRNDLVYLIDGSGSDDNRLYIALSQPFTNEATSIFNAIEPANGEHFFTGMIFNDEIVANGSADAPDTSLWQLFDYDGDGYQDIVYPDGASWKGMRWNPDVSGNLNAPVTLGQIRPNDSSGEPDFVQITDADGDGLSDLLYGFISNELYVNINRMDEVDGNGQAVVVADYFGQPVLSQLPAPVAPQVCNTTACSITAHSFGFGAQTNIFDYNGDGAVDLLVREFTRYETGTPNNNISGYDVLTESMFDAQMSARLDDINNGFGASNEINVGIWTVLVSDSSGQFIRGPILAKTLPCDSTGPECTVPPLVVGNQSYLLDLNGDSLADFIYHECTNGQCIGGEGEANDEWHYRINTGNGFASEVGFNQSQLPDDSNDVRFVDINGDGLTEILWVQDEDDDNANWHILLNDFNGFETSATVSASLRSGELAGGDFSLFADVSGDGKTDHLFFDYGVTGNLEKLELQWGQSTNPVSSQRFSYEARNVVTSIVDGFGATTNIEYRKL